MDRCEDHKMRNQWLFIVISQVPRIIIAIDENPYPSCVHFIQLIEDSIIVSIKTVVVATI